MNVPGTDYTYGTVEHADAITEGRHPGVRDGLQWLAYVYLPPQFQQYAAPFYHAAVALLKKITQDSPELTTAINKLIEAKDSAVRAGIRCGTGHADSISRSPNYKNLGSTARRVLATLEFARNVAAALSDADREALRVELSTLSIPGDDDPAERA